MAKRKPKLGKLGNSTSQNSKQPAAPKKFSAFSKSDSNSLETRYQKLLEATEEKSGRVPGTEALPLETEGAAGRERAGSVRSGCPQKPAVKVPVNEDFLFDVDIEQRELLPVYWEGPVYEGIQFPCLCHCLFPLTIRQSDEELGFFRKGQISSHATRIFPLSLNRWEKGSLYREEDIFH